MKCLSRGFMLSLGSIVLYTFGARSLRELGDSTHFPFKISGGAKKPQFSLSEMGDRTIPNFERTYILFDAPLVCIRCQVCCFVSELEPLKGQT